MSDTALRAFLTGARPERGPTCSSASDIHTSLERPPINASSTLMADSQTLQWTLAPSSLGKAANGGASDTPRVEKRAREWSSIPANILHRILSAALEDHILPAGLYDAWGRSWKHADLAMLMYHRVSMCRWRGVSPGWKVGVDSHPFWSDYARRMNPGKGIDSNSSDTEPGRTSSSAPTPSSLFARARSSTLGICLACRVNQPGRLEVYPTSRRKLTFTQKLGWAPTCDRHYGEYCINCLRESEVASGMKPISGTYAQDDESALSLYGCRDDVDEYGHGYTRGGNLCRHCRILSLENQLIRQLRACTTLPLGPLLAHLIQFDIAESYAQFGESGASEVADSLIEYNWLRSHSLYEQMLACAADLCSHERELRELYLKENVGEDVYERGSRHAMLAELYNTDVEDMGEILAAEDVELNMRYRVWFLQNQKRIEHDDDDLDSAGLDERWTRKLRDAQLRQWTEERICAGYWIYPTEEYKLFDKGGHQVLALLADGARYPLEDIGRPVDFLTPIDVLRSGSCLLRIDPRDPLIHLPTARLLEDLDGRYAERLREILTPAFKEIVAAYRHVAPARELEGYLEEVTLGTLLEQLANPDAWTRGGLRKMMYLTATSSSSVPTHDGQSAMVHTMAESNVARPRAMSPIIELIEEDEPLETHNFAIVEVEQDSEGSSPLGKRKLPPGEEGDEEEHSERRTKSSRSDLRASPDHESAQITAVSPRSPKNGQVDDAATGSSRRSSESESETTTELVMPITPEDAKAAVMPEPDASDSTSEREPEPEPESGIAATKAMEHIQAGSQNAWEEWKRDEQERLGQADGKVKVFQVATPTPPIEVAAAIGNDRSTLGLTGKLQSAIAGFTPSPSLSPSPSSSPAPSSSPSPSSLLGDSDNDDLLNQLDHIDPYMKARSDDRRNYVVPIDKIPWIPGCPSHLTPTTRKLLNEIWRDTWASVRECRCGICERGRSEVDMAALAGGMDWGGLAMTAARAIEAIM